MRKFLRFIAVPIFVYACGGVMITYAHTPMLMNQKNVDDVIRVDDPSLSQAFYGTLNNFPHTYEIIAREPFTLYTEILVPDIEGQTNTPSGIIIKLPQAGGRVEEIARLQAKDASWEAAYEFFGGDTYRHGPQFEKELPAGTYRVEVHSADNKEKYVLVIGKREEVVLGYIELIRRIAGVKEFFGKSQISIIQSPFIFIPLLVGAVIVGWLLRRRLRHIR